MVIGLEVYDNASDYRIRGTDSVLVHLKVCVGGGEKMGVVC